MTMKHSVGLIVVLAGIAGLVWWVTPPQASERTPTDLIAEVRELAWAEAVDDAKALIEQHRPGPEARTSAWFAAVSWLARGASFAGRWDQAEQYAQEAYDGSLALLGDRSVDDDPDLATALGAAIEVLGHAQDVAGDRPGAVTFLETQHARFDGTSLERRIQKNALLLSLQGQPFPELDVEHQLGPPPPTAASLEGKVVVAFFWAHWCPDCKRQLPVLEALYRDYGDRDLVVVGPTQLFGYTTRGQVATPEQELAYLQGAYQEQHPLPPWMSVPVSAENFDRFGVSTTPTLILIDRDRTVQLYNPGDLPYEELAAQVERLLG